MGIIKNKTLIDMENSSYKIFSLYKRISYTFTEMNFEMYPRLLEPVEKRWFEHTAPFIKRQCYRIWNEIENSYYSFNDLVSFLIYDSIWNSPVDLMKVNDKTIETFKEEFTELQLEKDRRAIAEINKQARLKDINEYFIIRDNGESLIYKLCMKRIVSVYFFCNYANTLLTGIFLRANLKERHKQYRKFDETCKILINQMNLITYRQKTLEKEE